MKVTKKLLTKWKESERVDATLRTKHASRRCGAEEAAKLRRTDLPNSERESLAEGEGATKV